MATWYWQTSPDGEINGPVSPAELKRMAMRGVLSREHSVWKDGMASWVKAHQLKGLFDPSFEIKDTEPRAQDHPAVSNTFYGQPDAPSVNIGSNGYASGDRYESNPQLFSFRGRLRRRDYFFQSIMLSILAAGIGVLAGFMMAMAETLALVLLIVFLPALMIILTMPVVKRLHDLDVSGWFFLISFVPFLNMIMGLALLFVKGTTGPNKFGPDPR